MNLKHSGICVLGLVQLWFVSIAAAQDELGAYPIEYVIHLDQPQTQTVRIEVLLDNPGGDEIELMLPVWRPGRYVVLDHAGAIRWVRAEDGSGRTLEMHKTAKSTWLVRADGAERVRVQYEVYANELGIRTRHVDDTHAFLDASSVLMYWPRHRGDPTRVVIDAPRAWAIASGLKPDPHDERALIAPDYDTLVDSPMEIGLHLRIDFEVDGVPHEIVIWGRVEPDRDQLIEDFTAIVQTQAGIFGEMPYRRFVFMIHAQPGSGGGTEHLNSTIMGTRPATFTDDKAYDRFLGLVSHEMFHTWNVKQLRPAGIVPYDYQRENYTDLLWVAEGSTSYYGDLTLVRTGLKTPKEYLKGLAKSIGGFRVLPGRRVQSLAESSFDAWIKFNKASPDSANHTVSFYRKGALVSLLLDMELRRATNNGVSYDAVMRAMYERYPLSAGGYTTDDMLETLHDLTGESFVPFFGRFVSGIAPLPLEEALATAGLTLERDEGDEDDEPGADAGFRVRSRDGLAEVSRVSIDGPAYHAGLMVGDLIVALDGERLRGGGLEDRLDRLSQGDSVTIAYLRFDRLAELTFTLDARPESDWTISQIDEPTEMQRAVYESWLGQPWESDDDDDDTDSDDDD